MKAFSISEALSYGWTKMKEEFSFVFLVTVIMWGLMLLSEGLYRFIDVKVVSPIAHDVILMVLVVITIVGSVILQTGYYKIFIKLYDDEEEVELPELYTNYRLSWKMALGSILQSLIMFIGFLLFILPGIYVALRYVFTKFIIADKEIGAIAALKLSAQLTKGVKFQLFKLALILWLINILGILLLVGIFITLPMSMLTVVYVYRKLEEQTSNR